MGEQRDAGKPDCVGAFILDDRHRVFAQRRSPTRRLLPGIWDIVGGHLEPGEEEHEALAREVAEETGWRLVRIGALIADWRWEHGGVQRRERDYLVEVEGDLGAPRLEDGKHDAWAWVGPDDLDLLMVGRTDGDHRLQRLVADAIRVGTEQGWPGTAGHWPACRSRINRIKGDQPPSEHSSKPPPG